MDICAHTHKYMKRDFLFIWCSITELPQRQEGNNAPEHSNGPRCSQFLPVRGEMVIKQEIR